MNKGVALHVSVSVQQPRKLDPESGLSLLTCLTHIRLSGLPLSRSLTQSLPLSLFSFPSIFPCPRPDLPTRSDYMRSQPPNTHWQVVTLMLSILLIRTAEFFCCRLLPDQFAYKLHFWILCFWVFSILDFAIIFFSACQVHFAALPGN